MVMMTPTGPRTVHPPGRVAPTSLIALPEDSDNFRDGVTDHF